MKAHGGRIWVDSPAEGGAAFRFTLPQVASTGMPKNTAGPAAA